jgi:hypothetical protein
MSAWLEATREVYDAGGTLSPHRASQTVDAYVVARRMGLIAPTVRGGKPKPAVITQLGIDLIEGRVVFRVPYTPRVNGGRAPGTHRRLAATWLKAMPRENEVRI